MKNIMKKALQTVYCFFITIISLWAQVDQCGQALDPTTDPSQPSNWDWKTPLWQMRYPGIVCDNGDLSCGKFSPFYDVSSSNVVSLSNYDINKPELRDMQPKDGWELITRKLGNPFTQEFTKDNPYLIMYNKYTGILRVFVYMTKTNQDYNGAAIEVSFLKSTGKMTGVLSKWDPNMNALDLFDKVNKDGKMISMLVPNYYANATGYWLHADFQTMYDPCTCGFKSTMKITPRLIQTSNVSLKINGTLTPEGAISNNGKITSDANNASSNSLSELGNGISSVSKAFKSSGGAIDFLSDYVEKQNPKAVTKKFDSYKAFERWQEDTYGAVLLDNVKYWNDGTVSGSQKQVKVASAGLNFLSKATGLLKYIPVIGQGLGFISDFISMFSGESDKVDEVKPVVSVVDLTANGTISFQSNPVDININTPGSDNADQSQYLNAEYDNILGVFNLIESPKLLYRDIVGAYGSGYESSTDGVREFQIENDLKYIVNPASGLEIETIKGALTYQIVASADFLFPLTGKEIPTAIPNEDNLYNNGFEIESWTGVENIYKNAVFRTRYVPIGSFKSLSIATNIASSLGKKLHLKLKITFKKTEANGKIRRIVQVFSYKTQLGTYLGKEFVNTHPNLTAYKGQIKNNYVGIEEFGYLSGTIQPKDYKSVNTLSLYDAIYNSNTLSNFTSGGQINITDETVISGEAIFQISDVHGSSRVIPPQNIEQITAFCNTANNKYNPVIPATARYAHETILDSNIKNLPKPILLLTAHPNPTSSQVTFTYNLNSDTRVRLYLTDLLGKEAGMVVNEIQTQGNHAATFDVSNLAPGLYLYTLEGEGFRETKRLQVVR